MANEITVSGALGITKPSLLLNRKGMSYTGLQYGLYGNTEIEGTMSVPAAATVIPLGGVTQPHWAMFANLATLGAAVTITGAANNGSGLIRLTASAHGYTTGQRVLIYGVVGTTEANGLWTITNISSSTFDLQSSTFTNTWTSGGTAQLGNGVQIQNGASGAVLLELLGGEVAGPLPLAPGSVPYANANVASTLLNYLIANL